MHNQTFTDDSECSSTTGLQRTQKDSCHTSLYLPCTGSGLQLASSSRHWCLHIEQPQAQHAPTSTHYYEFTSPPEVWDLRVSNALWCHHREAQHHSPERFHSPFLAGGMIFPPSSRILNPWQFSSDTWKRISSVITWLHQKNKKNKNTSLSFLNFAHFLLTYHCLARIWTMPINVYYKHFLCLFTSL